jgi:CRISPR-associated protein Cas5h
MVTTNLDVVERECLSFTVRGPWAHFRRIDTTVEKLTYRVIPRTTVAGLLAAVLGEPRDSYYDTFEADNSAIAISVAPECELETQAIPQLTLPTTQGDLNQVTGTSRSSIVDPKQIAASSQRRTFEYIVDAGYQIDIVLDDEETFNRLREFLDSGKATYTPCLGKTECLADLTDVNASTIVDEGDPEAIDSTVPEQHIAPEPGRPLRMERTPAYMRADSGGRQTTGFTSYGYAPNGETIVAPSAPAVSVDGRSVCFR